MKSASCFSRLSRLAKKEKYVKYILIIIPWRQVFTNLCSFPIFNSHFYNSMLTFQPSVMAERKSNLNEMAKLQHELLDYMGIVKGEISDTVVLLEQFLDDSYDKGGPTHNELEKLLKKSPKSRSRRSWCPGLHFRDRFPRPPFIIVLFKNVATFDLI